MGGYHHTRYHSGPQNLLCCCLLPYHGYTFFYFQRICRICSVFKGIKVLSGDNRALSARLLFRREMLEPVPPELADTNWVSSGSVQSWHCPPGVSIWSLKLRTQSHKIAPTSDASAHSCLNDYNFRIPIQIPDDYVAQLKLIECHMSIMSFS